MLEIIKVSTDGRVHLPAAVRKRFALRQGDRVAVTVENDRIVLQPLDAPSQSDCRRWRGVLANTDGDAFAIQLAMELRAPLATGDPEIVAVHAYLGPTLIQMP